MRLRLYESATASRFVFSRKFIALQLSTFATKSAQSDHSNLTAEFPLLGVKRTCLFAARTSAFDPKRTLTQRSGALVQTFAAREYNRPQYGCLSLRANQRLQASRAQHRHRR